MPIKYIGRTTDFLGKELGYILYNLPNFGVGRMVYRNMMQRYPEPCYYKISRIEPRTRVYKEPYGQTYNPSYNPGSTKVEIFAQAVFRGEDKGEVHIQSYMKHDWRLVPRHEEDKFINADFTPRAPTIIPESMYFPPLMEKFVQRDQKLNGVVTSERPLLSLDGALQRGVYNRARLQTEADL